MGEGTTIRFWLETEEIETEETKMSNNKFKVLIVEDEANICSFIETLLETNGYQALVAIPVPWA